MARTFHPVGDRVVIQPLEEEEARISSGGIYIPDTAKERPQEGTIIAVGPGRTSDEGKRIPLEVKIGDKVVYSKYSGTEFKEDGTEYLIVRESDILAKLA